jgi:hypothetical protein
VRAGAFAQSNGLKWENVPAPRARPVPAYPRFRINTATNKPGALIKIPRGDIAITPNGKTAYVTSSLGVTPINIATSKAGKLIKVAGGAGLIVITP